MRKGWATVMLGLIASLGGMWILYCVERKTNQQRNHQACGWGILGFGLAYVLLGGSRTLKKNEKL